LLLVEQPLLLPAADDARIAFCAAACSAVGTVFCTEVLSLAGSAAVVRINMPGMHNITQTWHCVSVTSMG
jgi:hypothetical protein